jgi:hypothetical protein
MHSIFERTDRVKTILVWLALWLALAALSFREHLRFGFPAVHALTDLAFLSFASFRLSGAIGSAWAAREFQRRLRASARQATKAEAEP